MTYTRFDDVNADIKTKKWKVFSMYNSRYVGEIYYHEALNSFVVKFNNNEACGVKTLKEIVEFIDSKNNLIIS